MLTYKEIAIEVLKSHDRPLSSNEIYAYAEENNLIDENKNGKTPWETIQSYISTDIKKYGKNSYFIRTNPGKFIYNPNNGRNNKDLKDEDKTIINQQKKTDSLFTGKGGEYLVCGELFFRGFYACPMPLDDGADILAIKNDKQYYIQVKTSNRNKNGTFNFTIRKDSFERYEKENMYYVLVPNLQDQKVFFILNCSEVRDIIYSFKGKNDCNIRLTEKNGKFSYKKKERIKNNWDNIK